MVAAKSIQYFAAKLCEACSTVQNDLIEQYDDCPKCFEVWKEVPLKIGEIFALLRIWAPKTHKNVDLLVEKALQLTANANIRDCVTGMSLLHYACQSGTENIGDEQKSLAAVKLLVESGANLIETSWWTQMTPLHYAVFFDCPKITKYLLDASKGDGIEARCPEFFSGTPMHLAALNASLKAAEVLLQFGADPTTKDNLAQTPREIAMKKFEHFKQQENETLAERTKHLIDLLQAAEEAWSQHRDQKPTLADIILTKKKLKLGDRVQIKGGRYGTLRFCGEVEFAEGIWGGIELDRALGKNDGSVGEQRYFKCKQNQGIFLPLDKIHQIKRAAELNFGFQNPTQMIESRKISGIEIGSNVVVGNQQNGVVRFIGETKFAVGLWYGIELDRRVGRNDGSVNGIRYFACPFEHGIFAPSSKIKLAPSISGPKAEKINRQRSLSSLSTVSSSVASSAASAAKETVKVYVKSVRKVGIVRYVGAVHFAKGIWFGLELVEPVGNTDGMVEGKRYFACSSRYGMMVAAKDIEPYQ